MIRRPLPLLGTFLALLLVLLAALPVAAYNNENQFHLRLSRLDPLQCGTSIRIQAQLTDKQGHPVSGATIHFAIDEGRRGDTLAPANVVTNAQGNAVTYVTLVCTNGEHQTQIVATGPGGAKARINLVLNDHHGQGDQGGHGGQGDQGGHGDQGDHHGGWGLGWWAS